MPSLIANTTGGWEAFTTMMLSSSPCRPCNDLPLVYQPNKHSNFYRIQAAQEHASDGRKTLKESIEIPFKCGVVMEKTHNKKTALGGRAKSAAED